MLMYDYGTNGWVVDEKYITVGGYMISFNHIKTVHNNYHHRDAVEPHNARHQEHI